MTSPSSDPIPKSPSASSTPAPSPRPGLLQRRPQVPPRAPRRWDLAEPLAADMLAAVVPPDNITYSTLISAARRCCRLDRSIHWFERMYAAGVVPDEVTYSAALDAYARLGRRHQVAALYDCARAAGWRPDVVAFAVLARMYCEAADYDGIQFVLSEMRALGVAPNAVVYNALLEALGKAGRPALARCLFDAAQFAGVVALLSEKLV